MKISFRSFSTVIALAILLGSVALSGCNSKPTAARVNGTAIDLSEVQQQMDAIKKQQPSAFEGTEGVKVEADYKGKILESLIQLELVKQAASDLGVKVADKEVNDYMAQLQTQYGGKKGLDEAMKQSGVTADQLKKSIANRLLRDAVIKKVYKGGAITDAEIATYYKKNLATFGSGPQVRAEHILLLEKDQALGRQLLTKVKNGGDFAALAKKYSTDQGTKVKGGDLGWASPTTYVPEFAKAVGEMKVGQARLVHSQFGWHVVKLLGTAPAKVKPLSEVKEQVRQMILQQKQSDAFAKYMEALKKKANVEIVDPEIKKAIDAAAKTTAPVPAP